MEYLMMGMMLLVALACACGVLYMGYLTATHFMNVRKKSHEEYIIKKKLKPCTWKPFDSYSTYGTGCGNSFWNASEDGCQVTEWATYCPYCGGEIDE